MRLGDSDSVVQWLEDVRLMTETECMCVLQGKSLTKEPADSVALLAKACKDAVDTIKGRAHIISSEFSKLFRYFKRSIHRIVQYSSVFR